MQSSNNNDDPTTLLMVAAVEGGGTSFRVAVASIQQEGSTQIVARTEVDSSHDQPQKTLEICAAFLKANKPPQGYHALGIATFGPVGVNVTNPAKYGRILPTTPKQAWRNVDLLTPLQKACQGESTVLLPVVMETDVNAPAFAEYVHYQRQGDTNLSSLAYITVGTGVGVGLIVNGKPVHGRMHPEGGHVPIIPLEGDPFEGYSWGKEKSPFQGRHTVEGIASSVALTERLQQVRGTNHQQSGNTAKSNEHVVLERSILSELSDDDLIWDHAANALANLCVTLLLVASVEKIVIGGGIAQRTGLLEKVQRRTVVLLNGYLQLPQDMSQLITHSVFGNEAGLQGTIVIAKRAYEDQQRREKQPCAKAKEQSVMKSPSFYWGIATGIALTASVLIGVMMNRRTK